MAVADAVGVDVSVGRTVWLGADVNVAICVGANGDAVGLSIGGSDAVPNEQATPMTPIRKMMVNSALRLSFVIPANNLPRISDVGFVEPTGSGIAVRSAFCSVGEVVTPIDSPGVVHTTRTRRFARQRSPSLFQR